MHVEDRNVRNNNCCVERVLSFPTYGHEHDGPRELDAPHKHVPRAHPVSQFSQNHTCHSEVFLRFQSTQGWLFSLLDRLTML